MKKILFMFTILAIFFIVGCGSSDNVQDTTQNTIEPPQIPEGTIDNNTINTEEVKTFVLTGKNFRFFIDDNESPDIKVKQGDKVRIEFTSTQGFHDWVVNEFDASTKRVNVGELTFVEFIADKKGMFGNLIVE